MRIATKARLGSTLALVLAMVPPAHGQEPPTAGFAAGIEVVARSLYFDLLDTDGKAVDDVPADSLELTENGVARTILEVRRRPPASTEKVARLAKTAGEDASTALAAPPQRFVLLALDPSTLGRSAWEHAIRQMSSSADAFTRIGPVDVTVLTAPPLRLASGATDPETVRRALARALREVKPLDEFYRGRSRFIRELQRIFDLVLLPIPSTSPDGVAARRRDVDAERILQAEFASRELVVEEQRLLDLSVGRLRTETNRLGRPLIAVWAAQGDPDTAGFVVSLLPEWVGPDDRIRFQGRPLGTSSSFEARWRELADDGVTLLCWSRVPDALLEVSSSSLRHSTRSRPNLTLGAESLTLFEIAAERTGGALVQSEEEIRQAVEVVGGRHRLVYQSDNASEGWREIQLRTTRPGWSVRVSPRVYVRASRPAEGREAPPPPLWTDLAATVGAGAKPGRETVTLSLVVDLGTLRQRLDIGTPLHFHLLVRATTPDGKAMGRESELAVPALPPEGDLRYQISLDVPVGTAGFTVDVREESSRAAGRAGPMDVLSGTPEIEPAAAAATLPSFTDATDVRLGEARFLFPGSAAPPPDAIRVTWKRHDQQVLRVAGGPGSSLEVGLVLDASESVRREREAFARTAAEAAQRLLGPTDRVFRVDFAGTPRFLGAARGGPAALFARIPPSPPEKTAIFDALRFALDRFEGRSDRAALIVFTDGCESASRTPVDRVIEMARRRAIPVFVVLADDRLCQEATATWGTKKDPMVYGSFVGSATAQAGAATVNRARKALTSLAESSGGATFTLAMAADAGPVWQNVESALARLWVALFTPSGPEVDSHEAEVRSATGEVLRPAD